MGVSQVDIGFGRMVRRRAARDLSHAVAHWSPAGSDFPQVCMLVQLQGRCTVEHEQWRLRLTPESWALWDIAGAARIRCEGRFDQVALLFPRVQLGEGPELQPWHPGPLSGHAGCGRLAFEAVRTLADGMEHLLAGDVASLSGVIPRLIRLSLEPSRVHRDARATSLSEK